MVNTTVHDPMYCPVSYYRSLYLDSTKSIATAGFGRDRELRKSRGTGAPGPSLLLVDSTSTGKCMV